MKQRRATSKRKWRNRFYRTERAAAFQKITREFLVNFEPNGDLLARSMVSTQLDVWLSLNSIGEIGEREIDKSPLMDWHTNTVMYRASVMAKRPYWIKHKRAEARA